MLWETEAGRHELLGPWTNPGVASCPRPRNIALEQSHWVRRRQASAALKFAEKRDVEGMLVVVLTGADPRYFPHAPSPARTPDRHATRAPRCPAAATLPSGLVHAQHA